MKRLSRFILGAAVGGFIGGAIVILFAPESGDNTRAAISTRFENLVKQIKTAMIQGKEELQKEIESYKNSAI